MTKCRIVSGLVALLAASIFLADVYLFPGLYVPTVVYVVPILIAAYVLVSPRLVAGIAVWVLALQVVAYWLEGAGMTLLPASYVLGLGFMSALSVALSDRAMVASRRATELQSVLDNMVDGVFVCDVRGRLTLANEAGARLLGLTGSEEVARPLADLQALGQMHHRDGRPVAYQDQASVRAVAGETVVMAEFVFHDRQAQRDVIARINASPIRVDPKRESSLLPTAHGSVLTTGRAFRY